MSAIEVGGETGEERKNKEHRRDAAELISVEEAAECLQIKPNTIYRHLRLGHLDKAVMRVFNRVLLHWPTLMAMIKAGELDTKKKNRKQ